ncbi:MAG TPA: Rieske (2Fe-2S) protein [Thermoanaerobaculia bacterium]|nr:Rieske (2Fe-2S) protein [Thermoanaerobaculia bacterium]
MGRSGVRCGGGFSRRVGAQPAATDSPETLDLIEIAKTEDVPVGTIRPFLIEGRKIVLYHTPKGFFASDNVCPHRGGPLSEGDLMGDEIVCPWHLWGFDLATGSTPINPDVRLVMHEVRVDGDTILIRLTPAEPSPFAPC